MLEWLPMCLSIENNTAWLPFNTIRVTYHTVWICLLCYSYVVLFWRYMIYLLFPLITRTSFLLICHLMFQWLDCIAQLLRLYPSAFEFSSVSLFFSAPVWVLLKVGLFMDIHHNLDFLFVAEIPCWLYGLRVIMPVWELSMQ